MIYPTSAMLYGKRVFINEVAMATLEREMLREQKINSAREALQRVRALRETRKVTGVEGIRHHVDDVDGDWLENWTVEELGNPCSNVVEVTFKSPVLVSLLVLHHPYLVRMESSEHGVLDRNRRQSKPLLV